eukprot:gb/GECG01003041.1/.p1 GENE.gb/GECG01003041.1/~~gb/GECG01003041.1/.p1  ORF type:complete len:244 (+),score=39.67 gb/GECG01003041.1/:1-732(+)
MASSSFELSTIRISVSLAPAYIGRVRLGVEEVLHEYLMKYRSDIDGVMLTYHGFKLPRGYDSATVMENSPFFHFKVDVKSLLFRPRIGSILTGVVNKCSSAHVGMLVCGLFNASIHAECFKDTHQFDSATQSWKPLDTDGQTIAVNSQVSFKVTELHTSSGIIALQGIPATEASEREQERLDKGKEQSKKHKKNVGKKRSRESEGPQEDEEGESMTTPKEEKRHKKDKKHSKSHKKKKSKVKE